MLNIKPKKLTTKREAVKKHSVPEPIWQNSYWQKSEKQRQN